MKSEANVQLAGVEGGVVRDYKQEYLAVFSDYLAKQPGIVRVLHKALKVFSVINFGLAGIFFVVGLYWTIVWITTGAIDQLGVAWANYGLSMSFLVFPYGLDIMLLRAWPTDLQPNSFTGPVNFRTGPMQILAGLGITAAGAPGAARMVELASQLLQTIF